MNKVDMAKEVSYEESLLKTHSLFTSNESPLDVMVEVVGNEKSLSQMEQREMGLTSHVDGDKITSARGGKKKKNDRVAKKKNDGMGKKRKQKGNGNVGSYRERNRVHLASAEKGRRRKDTNFYKVLRALLPQLPPKVSTKIH